MGIINWSHRKPISVPTSSVQKPPTTILKAASVDSFAAQIDTATPNSTPNRSSEGEQPFLHLVESPRLGAVDSLRKALGGGIQSGIPSTRKENPDTSISTTEDGLSRIEEEESLSSQTRDSVIVQNPSCLDFPLTPLSLAVDASADGIRTKDPSSPTTPLDFARYGYISRESFVTSVLPLLQSAPDSPIGGREAAVLSHREVEHHPQPISHASTVALHNNLERYEPPRIEVSSPKISISGYEKASRKALRSCSNLSDPLSVEQSSDSDSLKTQTIAAVTHSPRQNLNRLNDGNSSDGPANDDDDPCGLEAIKRSRKAVEKSPATEIPPEHEIKATSDSTKDGALNDSTAPGNIKHALAVGQAGEIQATHEVIEVPAAQAPSNSKNAPSSPIRTEVARSVGIPNKSAAPRLVDIEAVPFPSSMPPELGIPIDGTGIPSIPTVPNKMKKRKGASVNKGVRKARKALLRRPILSVVVGRKLAKPTRDLLKLAVTDSFIVPEATSVITG
ncbi:hypothetical protein GLAREA_05394 [Glarea lozoyensis ATCC 20868]|uniref:Uncharacterized protein n=1 Tax=Glarea lozoyensis (strain ATCC 20868 / MF5171) TaxID=1116229 RepID=S3DVR7_GLAL2|nr:uncharacterized protein GLAREA_05394 [Glarea lozoyensis ATCC 20868]EPE36056.1 hypothetical protein GLAREA_05394 [Glarea lozoyensis ATCC 20868]